MAHERHVVRDEDDREAEPLLKLLDLRHQRALGDDVERRGRLVHDHEVGREQERHRDHRPLAHPARQLVRIAVQVDRVDQTSRSTSSERALISAADMSACALQASRICAATVTRG